MTCCILMMNYFDKYYHFPITILITIKKFSFSVRYWAMASWVGLRNFQLGISFILFRDIDSNSLFTTRYDDAEIQKIAHHSIPSEMSKLKRWNWTCEKSDEEQGCGCIRVFKYSYIFFKYNFYLLIWYRPFAAFIFLEYKSSVEAIPNEGLLL